LSENKSFEALLGLKSFLLGSLGSSRGFSIIFIGMMLYQASWQNIFGLRSMTVVLAATGKSFAFTRQHSMQSAILFYQFRPVVRTSVRRWYCV